MRLTGGCNRSFRTALLAAASVLIAFTRPGFAQTVVTMCGQEVSGSATLPTDLDCTGFDGNAVTMHGGTLAMNGHTITGADTGVYCDHKCTIVGPGLVTGASTFGIDGFNTSVHLNQVDVTNVPILALQCFKTCAVEGPATFSGNGGAIVGHGATIRNVTITENYNALDIATNGGSGSVKIYNSTITGNRYGVRADRRAKVLDSTITDNAFEGIVVGLYKCPRKGIISLKRSIVTGNGTDASCGITNACADLMTCGTAPRLDPTSACDHSYVDSSGIPGDSWHVCSLD